MASVDPARAHQLNDCLIHDARGPIKTLPPSPDQATNERRGGSFKRSLVLAPGSPKERRSSQGHDHQPAWESLMNRNRFPGQRCCRRFASLRARTRESEGVNGNTYDQPTLRPHNESPDRRSGNATVWPVLPDSARHGGLKAFVNFFQMRPLQTG